MIESVAWPVLGIDLVLRTGESGGRSKPLGVVPYERYQYRPNWTLPSMTFPEQAGAWVLCFGSLPLRPGGRSRAVIVPNFEQNLPLWREVAVGDELVLCEGTRDCGRATVEWIVTSEDPGSVDEESRFVAWAECGPAPLVLGADGWG